jgi:hypothetical protein
VYSRSAKRIQARVAPGDLTFQVTVVNHVTTGAGDTDGDGFRSMLLAAHANLIPNVDCVAFVSPKRSFLLDDIALAVRLWKEAGFSAGFTGMRELYAKIAFDPPSGQFRARAVNQSANCFLPELLVFSSRDIEHAWESIPADMLRTAAKQGME